MKILLVDDSESMRRIQMMQLKKMGHTDIVESINGQDALEKLKVHKIDLVLLDWNMPVINGMECLMAIRADDATKTIPVIMVTSESDQKQKAEALKCGANDYLLKPFKQDQLEEKIKLLNL